MRGMNAVTTLIIGCGLSTAVLAVKPMAEDEMSDVSFNDAPLPVFLQQNTKKMPQQTNQPVSREAANPVTDIATSTPLSPADAGVKSAESKINEQMGNTVSGSLGDVSSALGMKTGQVKVSGVSTQGDVNIGVQNGQIGISAPVQIDSIKLDSIQLQQPGLNGFSLRNIEFQNTTATVHVR